MDTVAWSWISEIHSFWKTSKSKHNAAIYESISHHNMESEAEAENENETPVKQVVAEEEEEEEYTFGRHRE
jgi:hypothetical protein